MASGTGTPPSGGSTRSGAVEMFTEAQRWYYNQQYQLLHQVPYKNCQTFQDAAIVFFPNPSTDFTHLEDMLSGSMSALPGAGWQEPWTNRAPLSNKQKLMMRVQVDDKQGKIYHLPLPIYCGSTAGVNSSESSATRAGLDTTKTEYRPLNKAQLGNHISKALKESQGFMDYCAKKGHKFEDLALYSLKQVSPGSWHPTLYVKANPPAPPSAIVDAGLARLREGHSIHQSAN